jgi:hypothetical protein
MLHIRSFLRLGRPERIVYQTSPDYKRKVSGKVSEFQLKYPSSFAGRTGMKSRVAGTQMKQMLGLPVERGQLFGVPTYKFIAARQRLATTFTILLAEIPVG